MRNVTIAIAAVAGAALITLFATDLASAATCGERAANCLQNGGARDTCYEPGVMAHCQKTGLYKSPSGRVWDAKLKCVDGPCGNYRGR